MVIPESVVKSVSRQMAIRELCRDLSATNGYIRRQLEYQYRGDDMYNLNNLLEAYQGRKSIITQLSILESN